MPLPTASVEPLNGWRQVGAPHWGQTAMHEFKESKDGQLQHFTDDQLRATIPPEGWDEYVSKWPAAAGVVDALRRTRR